LNSRPDILDPARTNALRLVHGGSDGWPGVYIERLADHLLLQSADAPDKILQQHLAALAEEHGCHGVYFKQLRRDVRKTDPGNASPELIQGTAAPDASPSSKTESGTRQVLAKVIRTASFSINATIARAGAPLKSDRGYLPGITNRPDC
jgi:hypothetical protein